MSALEMLCSDDGPDTAVEACAGWRLRLVTDDAGFAALEPAWRQLAGDCPFHSWMWMDAWWRHYRHVGAELFTAVVNDESGDVVAIAPW